MKKLPSITILTGTYNSHIPTFKTVLESIRKQKYPKKLIEHIVFDKGSTNGCVELAKKYGCRVVKSSPAPGKEQISAALGIKMAKGDLILVLESDNILTNSSWLMDMVLPFLEDKKVFCTYSAYNTYKKNMSLTTKYSALFGAPDPTLYYLDKSEKIPLIQKIYNKGKIIKETNKYYIVTFARDTLPTLGDNGHMFLKKAMLRVIRKPEEYTHTDAFMDMFDLGYNTFGVVKNSIIHTMNPRILDLVKRRVAVKQTFYDGRRKKRKYLVYNPNSSRDRINLFKYIIFSITFIVPFFESVRGYIKMREKAWFIHSLFCFLMVVGYGVSEIKHFTKRLL